ncbi:hypothetical protein BBK14_27525 [Parafrankia soli]|uniref:Uncharacterized protein n=1 Tax=Parafrankia soli TaxID=2599596 RepID=A0A1S1PI23_9ACTN|nr:hypothetical protein BBK14_27525 [Parafrankia soli]
MFDLQTVSSKVKNHLVGAGILGVLQELVNEVCVVRIEVREEFSQPLFKPVFPRGLDVCVSAR